MPSAHIHVYQRIHGARAMRKSTSKCSRMGILMLLACSVSMVTWSVTNHLQAGKWRGGGGGGGGGGMRGNTLQQELHDKGAMSKEKRSATAVVSPPAGGKGKAKTLGAPDDVPSVAVTPQANDRDGNTAAKDAMRLAQLPLATRTNNTDGDSMKEQGIAVVKGSNMMKEKTPASASIAVNEQKQIDVIAGRAEDWEQASIPAAGNKLVLPSPNKEKDTGNRGKIESVASYRNRILWFTMDSLTEFIEHAARGGPSGEIKIRSCLVNTLQQLGIEVTIASSDKQFEALVMKGAADYGVIILDPWTWAAKGWVWKPGFKNLRDRVFIMDFFGDCKGHPNLQINPSKFLTAFPVLKCNTFLGYFVPPVAALNDGNAAAADVIPMKKNQGVIWGKVPQHFMGSEKLLRAIADVTILHAVTAEVVINHNNIKYHGHLSSQEWQKLLAESKFLIGLGDPLAGPSAMDALSAGAMYLDPIYDAAKKIGYLSQHPYLANDVGEPYVCSFNQKDIKAALKCVNEALKRNLSPYIPQLFSPQAYELRVRTIFGDYLDLKPP